MGERKLYKKVTRGYDDGFGVVDNQIIKDTNEIRKNDFYKTIFYFAIGGGGDGFSCHGCR